MQFPTAGDALAEALARHGIDPSTVEVTKMYGKNPNLVGPNGEPWEVIRGLDSNGEILKFDHHASGHLFDDSNEFGFGVRSCPRKVISIKRYDIFGRVVQSVAADGFTAAGAALSNIADFTTQNAYDADDNLLSVQHGTGAGNVQVYSQTSQGSTARNLTQTLQGQVLPPQVH